MHDSCQHCMKASGRMQHVILRLLSLFMCIGIVRNLHSHYRLNSGVILEPLESPLINIKNYYGITLKYNLPKCNLNNFDFLALPCSYATHQVDGSVVANELFTICNTISQLMNDLNDINLNACNKINSIETDIMQIMDLTSAQSKRSDPILPFLDTFFSALTGAPSRNDFNKLLTIIDKITNDQHAQYNGLNGLIDKYNAFIHVEDKRFNNFHNFINTVMNDTFTEVQTEITNIIENYSSLDRRLANGRNFTLNIFNLNLKLESRLKYTLALTNNITLLLNEFGTAMTEIINNKLPESIIPPKLLKSILNNHTSHINENGYSYLYNKLTHYYKYVDYSIAYKNGVLFIKLNIPLRQNSQNNEMYYDLYRVHVIPTVFYENSTFYNEVQNLPDIYGISPHKYRSIEMSMSDFSLCKSGNYYECNGVLNTHVFDRRTSCIDAIFSDDMKSSMNLCDHKLFSGYKPRLFSYKNNIIGSNINGNVTITCPDNIRNISTCLHPCKLELDCECFASFDNLVAYPTTQHCGRNFSSMHSLNLPAINAIFRQLPENVKLSTLLFEDELKIIPKVSQKFKLRFESLAKMDNFSNMAFVADRVHDESIITNNNSHVFFKIDKDSLSIIPTLSFTLHLLSLVFIYFLHRQIKSISLLACISNAKAEERIFWNNFLETTEAVQLTTTPSYTPGFDSTKIACVSVVVSFCMVILLLVHFWLSFKVNRTKSSQLTLLLYNEKGNYIQLPLIKFDEKANSMRFENNSIDDNVIKGIKLHSTWYKSVIKLTYGQVKFYTGNFELTLPSEVKLSKFASRKIAELIKLDFVTLILLSRNDLIYGYFGDPAIKIPELKIKGNTFPCLVDLQKSINKPNICRFSRRNTMLI